MYLLNPYNVPDMGTENIFHLLKIIRNNNVVILIM